MQIHKRVIDIPKHSVSKLTDYPPKFLIQIQQTLDGENEPPKLLIEGLDIPDCSFELLMSPGTLLSKIHRNI